MSFEQLKEVAYSDSKKVFHSYRDGVVISATIQSVEPYYDGIQFNFNDGYAWVFPADEIRIVPMPSDLITECEISFSLSNKYGHIGYIFVPKTN